MRKWARWTGKPRSAAPEPIETCAICLCERADEKSLCCDSVGRHCVHTACLQRWKHVQIMRADEERERNDVEYVEGCDRSMMHMVIPTAVCYRPRVTNELVDDFGIFSISDPHVLDAIGGHDLRFISDNRDGRNGRDATRLAELLCADLLGLIDHPDCLASAVDRVHCVLALPPPERCLVCFDRLVVPPRDAILHWRISTGIARNGIFAHVTMHNEPMERIVSVARILGSYTSIAKHTRITDYNRLFIHTEVPRMESASKQVEAIKWRYHALVRIMGLFAHMWYPLLNVEYCRCHGHDVLDLNAIHNAIHNGEDNGEDNGEESHRECPHRTADGDYQATDDEGFFNRELDNEHARTRFRSERIGVALPSSLDGLWEPLGKGVYSPLFIVSNVGSE